MKRSHDADKEDDRILKKKKKTKMGGRMGMPSPRTEIAEQTNEKRRLSCSNSDAIY